MNWNKGVLVFEKWLHRADLAEQAINERHAQSLWMLPKTNLAVVAWPPSTKEKLHYRWHYWWQAHYLDCLVDAASRRATKARKFRIQQTVLGLRIRQLGRLTRNKYYDDKSWLALAMARARKLEKKQSKPKYLRALEANIVEGIDSTTGVLPWRVGEHFFNVPTNGPAAIMLARNGDIAQARELVDWMIDNLLAENGLIMDGIRMTMEGPKVVKPTHPYCQGVVIGACVEIAEALRERDYEASVRYLAHARALVHAVAKEMATPAGVIDWATGDGDGGLFKGILVRYLADLAVRIPEDNEANIATKRIARRLVMASAESVWSHRLEVDGLPVFPTDWTEDARLPHNFGVGGSSLSDIVRVVRIDERDLSVQLSGWMLLEAAARVSELSR